MAQSSLFNYSFGPSGSYGFNNAPVFNPQSFAPVGGAAVGSGPSIPNLPYAPEGQTLGAATTSGPIGPKYNGPQAQPVTQQQQGFIGPQYDPNADSNRIKGEIAGGWDQYIGQLNDMLNIGLPGQRQAQEQMAQTAYGQGVNQITGQKQSSEQAVQTQQKSSLKDLSDNIRNLFQSGNVYLGSRGAGDSSAADQYSYAVTKMGTKARGDVMSQVNQRMQQIGDIYNQALTQLKSDYDNKVAGIAQWFNEAQNSIRQNIGQAGLNKSKDIAALSTQLYNTALQAMQQVQAEMGSRRTQLESWAANNAKNVQELVSNMQTVQQMQPFQGIPSGMPQVGPDGSYVAPIGWGNSVEKKRDIFET